MAATTVETEVSPLKNAKGGGFNNRELSLKVTPMN
jgi:hypothetical protein